MQPTFPSAALQQPHPTAARDPAPQPIRADTAPGDGFPVAPARPEPHPQGQPGCGLGSFPWLWAIHSLASSEDENLPPPLGRGSTYAEAEERQASPHPLTPWRAPAPALRK